MFLSVNSLKKPLLFKNNVIKWSRGAVSVIISIRVLCWLNALIDWTSDGYPEYVNKIFCDEKKYREENDID